MRSLLLKLDAWVADDVLPPPSVYPTLAEASLVPRSRLRFPAIPGVDVPVAPSGPLRLEYGPSFGRRHRDDRAAESRRGVPRAATAGRRRRQRDRGPALAGARRAARDLHGLAALQAGARPRRRARQLAGLVRSVPARRGGTRAHGRSATFDPGALSGSRTLSPARRANGAAVDRGRLSAARGSSSASSRKPASAGACSSSSARSARTGSSRRSRSCAPAAARGP